MFIAQTNATQPIFITQTNLTQPTNLVIQT